MASQFQLASPKPSVAAVTNGTVVSLKLVHDGDMRRVTPSPAVAVGDFTLERLRLTIAQVFGGDPAELAPEWRGELLLSDDAVRQALLSAPKMPLRLTLQHAAWRRRDMSSSSQSQSASSVGGLTPSNSTETFSELMPSEDENEEEMLPLYVRVAAGEMHRRSDADFVYDHSGLAHLDDDSASSDGDSLGDSISVRGMAADRAAIAAAHAAVFMGFRCAVYAAAIAASAVAAVVEAGGFLDNAPITVGDAQRQALRLREIADALESGAAARAAGGGVYHSGSRGGGAANANKNENEHEHEHENANATARARAAQRSTRSWGGGGYDATPYALHSPFHSSGTVPKKERRGLLAAISAFPEERAWRLAALMQVQRLTLAQLRRSGVADTGLGLLWASHASVELRAAVDCVARVQRGDPHACAQLHLALTTWRRCLLGIAGTPSNPNAVLTTAVAATLGGSYGYGNGNGNGDADADADVDADADADADADDGDGGAGTDPSVRAYYSIGVRTMQRLRSPPGCGVLPLRTTLSLPVPVATLRRVLLAALCGSRDACRRMRRIVSRALRSCPTTLLGIDRGDASTLLRYAGGSSRPARRLGRALRITALRQRLSQTHRRRTWARSVLRDAARRFMLSHALAALDLLPPPHLRRGRSFRGSAAGGGAHFHLSGSNGTRGAAPSGGRAGGDEGGGGGGDSDGDGVPHHHRRQHTRSLSSISEEEFDSEVDGWGGRVASEGAHSRAGSVASWQSEGSLGTAPRYEQESLPLGEVPNARALLLLLQAVHHEVEAFQILEPDDGPRTARRVEAMLARRRRVGVRLSADATSAKAGARLRKLGLPKPTDPRCWPPPDDEAAFFLAMHRPITPPRVRSATPQRMVHQLILDGSALLGAPLLAADIAISLGMTKDTSAVLAAGSEGGRVSLLQCLGIGSAMHALMVIARQCYSVLSARTMQHDVEVSIVFDRVTSAAAFAALKESSLPTQQSSTATLRVVSAQPVLSSATEWIRCKLRACDAYAPLRLGGVLVVTDDEDLVQAVATNGAGQRQNNGMNGSRRRSSSTGSSSTATTPATTDEASSLASARASAASAFASAFASASASVRLSSSALASASVPAAGAATATGVLTQAGGANISASASKRGSGEVAPPAVGVSIDEWLSQAQPPLLPGGTDANALSPGEHNRDDVAASAETPSPPLTGTRLPTKGGGESQSDAASASAAATHTPPLPWKRWDWAHPADWLIFVPLLVSHPVAAPAAAAAAVAAAAAASGEEATLAQRERALAKIVRRCAASTPSSGSWLRRGARAAVDAMVKSGSSKSAESGQAKDADEVGWMREDMRIQKSLQRALRRLRGRKSSGDGAAARPKTDA